MKKTYTVKTYDEFTAAVEMSNNYSGVVINITNDILLSRPIEISGCTALKITSENGCLLTGGIINGKWEKSGEFLTFSAEAEPRMLIINGKPVKRTSYPAEGYLENMDISKYEWLNSRNGGWDKTPTEYDLTHITVNPEDIPDGFDIKNCDIRAIHTWDESTVSVKNYDASSGIIECANQMAHPAGAFGVHKYQFLNTKFGLAQKGRWYYDRCEKKIYYCPNDGENENNITSMIPICKSLIIIKDCKNIKLSNLKLLLSNSEIGTISGLRAINPCGAVQVENSKDISLDTVEITFSGGQGIKCLKSKNLKITNCIIENCASCGIATFECEDELISYNVIKDIGLSDFSAVSVHAGGKSELVYVMDGCKEEHGQTVIEYNSIDGSPYCGIACSGGPHIIRNNKVTRCMQTLKDGGAVYCSRAEGTIIKANYVSHVPSDTAYAFYLDELSEKCIVDGNVSVNVNIPFTSHIAKNCTLSNNLFINNDETTIRLMRSDNFSFKNNIVISAGNLVFFIKSYVPEEKYTMKICSDFSGDIICAPKIKVVPEEKTNITRLDKLEFTKEHDRFVFEKIPNDICNIYIVSKSGAKK